MARQWTRLVDRLHDSDRWTLGTSVFGGSGLAMLLASVAGMCPFCVVGLPCPVCALGATPIVGGLFGGAGLSSLLGDDESETTSCCGSETDCNCCGK
ncbi:MAG: hypothetical protein ABEI96_09945 [Haloarculaceae archaeon]